LKFVSHEDIYQFVPANLHADRGPAYYDAPYYVPNKLVLFQDFKFGPALEPIKSSFRGEMIRGPQQRMDLGGDEAFT
jgi:hypothetical protein